ncbi:IS3 family transposase [Kosakonia sp. S42]|nr:transposase [Kosakonia sp. S42]
MFQGATSPVHTRNRRITATLRQSGMTINHKKVQRLMGKLSLCARIR